MLTIGGGPFVTGAVGVAGKLLVGVFVTCIQAFDTLCSTATLVVASMASNGWLFGVGIVLTPAVGALTITGEGMGAGGGDP